MALDQYGKVVPDAPTTGWRITYQQETVDAGPDGRVVAGVKVGFTTGAGVGGSVFLPQAQYTPTNVRAAVAARAAQLDEVQRMTG